MKLRLLAPLAVVLLAGCSKNIQNNDAVRDAVIKHLSNNSGLQVSAMDIEVAAVTFRDNEADATISFKPKGAPASAGMQMKYTLEKQGGTWVVKKKSNSSAHGAAMPGAPPPAMPGGTATTPNMPPGHPPVMPGKAPESK